MAGDMGLFGAPVGIIAAGDYQKTQAQTQEELARAASYPSEIRLKNAQAGVLEETLKENQALGALMQRSSNLVGDDGKPLSLGDTYERLARLAAGARAPTKAMDLAKTAALLQSREATAFSAGTTARLNQLRAFKENAALQGQIFGNVKNQQDWDSANALYEFQTGMPSQYRGIPYSSDLVDRINSSALTAAQRADEEAKRLTREALDTYRERRLSQIDTQNEIRKQAQRTREERERRMAKAGGGSAVSSPAKSETDQAARLIRKDFSNMDAADLNDAAFNLASEARALRRQNKALDAGTALQQAYNSAVASGDFQTDSGYAGTGFGKKTTYSGRGKTADTPAPIPADRKQLTVDRYYVNPQGQVGRWTGKGFLIERPLSGNNRRVNAEPDTEPDDDEDEE